MTPFDRREALRYMGVRGALDAGVQALVEEAAHLLEPRAHYRVLQRSALTDGRPP